MQLFLKCKSKEASEGLKVGSMISWEERLISVVHVFIAFEQNAFFKSLFNERFLILFYFYVRPVIAIYAKSFPPISPG